MGRLQPNSIGVRSARYLALSSLILALAAAAQSALDVPIWTTVTGPNSHVKTAYYGYSFPRDKLMSAKSWDYQTEEFPLELGAETVRARFFLLASRPTNEFTLRNITMRRVSTVRDRLDRAEDAGDLTNKWFVAFTFFMESDGPKRSVVALVDRSYGRECAISEVEESRIYLHSDVNSPSSAERHAIGHFGPIFTNNYDLSAELNAKGFKVPAVEWNPLADKFPLSLHSEVTGAEAFLRKELRVPDQPLDLIEIYIRPFTPTGAMQASNLDPREHLHHWVLVLRFRHNLNNMGADYYVYGLLDGTFMRAVQSAMPETGVIVDP